MLKLFTNTNLLTEQNRGHVFPLLFDLHYLRNETLGTFYSIVSDIKDCDIVVVPLEYVYTLKTYSTILNSLLEQAAQVDKLIWVYSGGDFGYTIKEDNLYNFRLSGFNSKLHDRSIIIPSFINDPYIDKLETNFTALHKNPVPEIGFVGHAKGGAIKYFKEFLSFVKVNLKRTFKNEYKDFQPFYPSSIKRAKYLHSIQKNQKIKANFILRNHYRAGVKTASEKEETTLAFYKNIYQNPYTFCLRGAGNFSVRFYETLAVGRIPVLINTDCKLPLSDHIDWNKHCLIIDEQNFENVEHHILKFHNNLSEDDFIQLQKSNRDLWMKSLKRESFFIKIHEHFINTLQLHE